MNQTVTTRDGVGLGETARDFLRRPGPLLLSSCLVTVLTWRVALGGWTIRELLAPAIILAIQPFVEWLVHVVLLHWRPRRVLGVTVDPYVARFHRAHHADPTDPRRIVIPGWIIALILLGTAVLFAVVADTLRIALTGFAAGTLALLAYEWVHWLIHVPYRPRRAAFRRLARVHLWHHFRNERYWFGVTSHLGDRVLRTQPAPASVPVSDTARTLGVPP